MVLKDGVNRGGSDLIRLISKRAIWKIERCQPKSGLSGKFGAEVKKTSNQL